MIWNGYRRNSRRIPAMIAVSDTSPICYLILIGEIDILPKLYSQALVPPAVVAELLHEDAPGAVRSWAANLPSWISAQQNPVGVCRLHAVSFPARPRAH